MLTEPIMLTDAFEPIPVRTGGEQVEIQSVSRLVEILNSFVNRDPRLIILSKQDGYRFLIGIGGELGGVTVYPCPSSIRSWAAKPRALYSSEDKWFTGEGEPSPYFADQLMPTLDVIKVVVETVENDELSRDVEWVDPKGRIVPSSSLKTLCELCLV